MRQPSIPQSWFRFVFCYHHLQFPRCTAQKLFTSTMSATERDIISRRLTSVHGYNDRTNDVFVLGDVTTATEHIIFFGGDIQDYPEKMQEHRDNKRYVEWNTEVTASKMLKKFPSSLVFVIKPAYMYLMTFSVYSNFWETSECCSPVHSENFNALEHLFKLYNSALEEVYGVANIPENITISIVGFSKGCTVMNQLVFELHLLQEVEHLRNFAKQFKCFYWLDGGHSGGSENTWVTQDAALNNLALLQCKIFIHVSPYQIKDPLRAWVGKEEIKFYKKLKKLNVEVYRIIHFETEPRSIENHFAILNEF